MQGTAGFDCSNLQGKTNLALAARAGYKFGLFKGSEGVGYEDAWAADNLQQAADSGLGRGLWHFARPDLSTADDEAHYYLDICARRGLRRGDIPALDLEIASKSGPTATLAWAQRWLQIVREGLKCLPVLYTGLWFVDGYMGGRTTGLTASGLWIADYDRSTWPTLPAGWSYPAFWQYSDAGRVPGINGLVCVDCFNGSMEQFYAYGLAA